MYSIFNFLIIGLLLGMSFALGELMNWFWEMFEKYADNSEIPDKPLRPDYITREITIYD